MIKKIQINMLGDFSVKADSSLIIEDATKLTTPWQLFCYLVLHKGEVVSSNTLLEVLWANEELADPANVLKNTVYALRKELCGSKVSPAESPVVFRSEGYCLNNHIKYVIDTEDFNEACGKAAKAGPEKENYTELLRSAYAAYKGEFLPVIDNERWVAQVARTYRNRFVEVAAQLCTALEKEQKWSEGLAVSTHANMVDPYDNASVLHMFRALQGMQMHRAIVATYSKTARFFAEELNITLCDEIEQIHNAAEEKVNRIEQDMLMIQEDLYELGRSQAHIKGAFFCKYETFRRMYLLLARTAQRSGDSVVLLLINVQDHKGRMPIVPQLNPAMDQLYHVISSCLRRSDVFCRYTKNQYVVLLPTNTMDNAQLVVERMKKGFAEYAGRLQLACRLSALENTEEIL